MATVFIPTPLRKFTNNTDRVSISSTNVNEVIGKLSEKFPDIKNHLIDTDGRITPFINIFVDNNDIRMLNSTKTIVREDTVIYIVPAIAGGKSSLIQKQL